MLSSLSFGLTYFFVGQVAFYFPRIFGHYSSTLRLLFAKYPHLRHNFSNSVFPACTFNAGPVAVSLRHNDSGNSAGGVCPITSGGSYDPKLGGHLILFDLKIVIEFPPGSTIILPSSTLSHGNTPVQQGETRVAFTQYCAGGLLRWVEYGFCSQKSCAQEQPGLRAHVDGKADERWLAALRRFSIVDDLHKDRVEVFKL